MAITKRLVVVGNGMAGVRLLECLVEIDPGWDVTVFGDEPHPAYDRVALSRVLAGGLGPEQVLIHDRAWYETRGLRLETGCPVTTIDRDRRLVTDAEGRIHPYDALVLATGSLPFVPPIEGAHMEGVLTFRTLDEVGEMIRRSESARRAVVVGGGLLGLECAHGLQRRGLEVSVLHLAGHLLDRQLDPVGGGLLRGELARTGMNLLLPASAQRIEGNGRAERVVLAGGAVLPADLVVICAGIRPNSDLARAAGLETGRGVVVDDGLRTSDERVYAIGECIEHRGETFGLVEPVVEQAAVLARILGGSADVRYESKLTATALKVAGVDVFAGGRTLPREGEHEVILRDDASFIYKKLVLRGDTVVGAALIGDVRTAPLIGAALTSGEVVRDRLKLLGIGIDPGSIPGEDLPDTAIVCGCNGVSKAAILEAIQRPEEGCATRACVARCTRASSSCGSCGVVVDGLLKVVGRAAVAQAAGPQTICACVPLSRQELRWRVLTEDLRSVGAVLAAAGDGVGCHRCRPALNYYLDVWRCGEFSEEPAHRHVNDRVHANVQKDGSFSVVPRMRGGVTTPDELRRIAEVAERYGVGMVKLTGGQRIDLLGVRKADLPLIWADLGMPSGHAYTKAIRTVKSCVGTEWCRFGVGDSTSLAVAIEEMLEGLYCPHKVKLAVAGCPRNCSEVTVKDLGVMAIVGGWEIYAGGAAGMTVRKGDLLCSPETSERALDEVAIAVQHYREEANYLERMYHFVPRVGLDAFRAATVEASPEVRAGLLDRFRRSRANALDPWREVPRREPWRFEPALTA